MHSNPQHIVNLGTEPQNHLRTAAQSGLQKKILGTKWYIWQFNLDQLIYHVNLKDI